MEACGGAHHWCRQLLNMGLDARMMAAALVAPYRMQGKGGKNDANDAAAICQGASRPQMRVVSVKTLDQQGMLCVHRLREGFKEERTACINRIRGLLAEFGIVLPQSPRVLRTHLHDILKDACTKHLSIGSNSTPISTGASSASMTITKTTSKSSVLLRLKGWAR